MLHCSIRVNHTIVKHLCQSICFGLMHRTISEASGDFRPAAGVFLAKAAVTSMRPMKKNMVASRMRAESSGTAKSSRS
jgi:hypothetical protein